MTGGATSAPVSTPPSTPTTPSTMVLADGMDLRCAHGGRLLPMAPCGRVRTEGRLVLTAGVGHAVHGCRHRAPDGRPSPCSIVSWLPGEVRLWADGQPVLLADAGARCTPNSSGVVIADPATARVRSTRRRVDGQV